MKINSRLSKLIKASKENDSYWFEKLKLNFAFALEKRRADKGLTNAALAEKLGTSPAYITKIFKGDANLTIESLAKLARATGGQIDIKIVDQTTKVKPEHWVANVIKLKTISGGNYRASYHAGTDRLEEAA